MAVVKIQSKVKKVEAPKKEEEIVVEQPEVESEEASTDAAPATKKPCPFCTGKNEPIYYDAAALRRFMNDRGRIVGRARSSVCAKHQRRISREIKRARHLALLPFTVQL